MSDALSGVLTQKPDSPYGVPEPGQTRRFSVEQKPKKSGDGTFNKLKNESGDFGNEYTVKQVKQLENWDSGQHGTFHQFSILVEPVSSQEGVGAVQPQGGAAPASASDRNDSIDRAVAFKVAGRVLAYEVSKSEGVLTASENARRLSELTDAFLPIVKGQAGNPPQATDGVERALTNAEDEIPF